MGERGVINFVISCKNEIFRSKERGWNVCGYRIKNPIWHQESPFAIDSSIQSEYHLCLRLTVWIILCWKHLQLLILLNLRSLIYLRYQSSRNILFRSWSVYFFILIECKYKYTYIYIYIPFNCQMSKHDKHTTTELVFFKTPVGSVPSGNKPLPEPKLTQVSVAIRSHYTTMS